MADSSQNKSMRDIVEIHKLELSAKNSSKVRELHKALEMYHRVLRLKSALKNKVGTARTLKSIGRLYYELGDYQKSKLYHDKLMELLDSLTAVQMKIDFYRYLRGFYEIIGDLAVIEFINGKLDALS
ncbi:MAG: tetratricopeptide repeat protein [Candidatus Lokiarchaeota archaeon]|nr:tetratricopeptide repeat protein [Candidatus Lokiarchaeota archaeon]